MSNKILTSLGLSEKEAQIYEATLESGPETVQKIAHRAGITRTGAYAYIRSLIQKGLMSSSTRDKRTYFSAEPPENLFRLLEQQKEKMKESAVGLKKILPRLQTIYETSEDRPHVRVFEGKDGLKTMTTDLLKSRFGSLQEFTSLDEAYAIVPPQPNDHREQIKKKFKKIPSKVIYTSKDGPILKQINGIKERRFIPKDIFPFTGSVNIYGNKISLTSRKKTITGVIIENKEIADTLRALFSLAWDSLRKNKE